MLLAARAGRVLTRTLNGRTTMERSYGVFESLGFVPPTSMGSPARAPSPSPSLGSLGSLNVSSKKAPHPKPTVDYSAVDEDKMMVHILDCLAALGHAQRHRVDCSHAEDSATAEVLAARDRVFKAALGVMVAALLPSDSEAAVAHDIDGSANGRNVDLVLQAFPDASKQVGGFPTKVDLPRCSHFFACSLSLQHDGRSWLPLHWAVALATADPVAPAIASTASTTPTTTPTPSTSPTKKPAATATSTPTKTSSPLKSASEPQKPQSPSSPTKPDKARFVDPSVSCHTNQPIAP